MKTAHETLAEFIQQMKDYELYWGGLTQKSLDEGTFLKLMKMKTAKKDLTKSKKYTTNFYLKKLYL
ncbi:hypothetical protein [Neisseria sicca]|uniref:hypothetical protein n=1 Tax=Neisseria sicca TaxID=490 RepID=UPI001F0CAD2E|nr:hypothetical protein [Neisseria sicca]